MRASFCIIFVVNIILIRHPFKQRDLTAHLYCKITENPFVVFLCFSLSHWRTILQASHHLLKWVVLPFCPLVPLVTNDTSQLPPGVLVRFSSLIQKLLFAYKREYYRSVTSLPAVVSMYHNMFLDGKKTI